MRRVISQLLFWLSPAVTAAGLWLMVRYVSEPAFQEQVVERYGWSQSEEHFFVPFFYVAGIQAVVVLIAYVLSLDARARRRPWLGMTVGAFGAGATASFAAYGFVYMQFNSQGWSAGLAGGAATALFLLAFELLNRWLWQSVVVKLDQRNLGGAALQFSRLALLWRPGQEALLLSVTMEQFRRGQRGEVADRLREVYAGGKRSPEILELLCQLAAEEKKPTEYIKYLKDLFDQFPDDVQLRAAYLEELLDQNRHAEALAHMEKYGVPPDEESLERYANLLVEAGRLDNAIDVARRLGDREGIPMRRADAVLRRVLNIREDHLAAVNLLADWAERMARKDQQIRWLDRSLSIDPTQMDRGLKLAELLEGAEMPQRLEKLLEALVRDQPGNLELRFRHARIVYANGRVEDTIPLLEELERKGLKSTDLYELLGQCYLEMNQLEEARGAVARGIKANPHGDTSLLGALAKRVERAVLSAELSQMMEEAERHPEKVDLQLQVIDRLVQSGHAERAVGAADALLHRQPALRPRVIETIELAAGEQKEGGFTLLNFIADLKVAEGRYDEALETIRAMADRAIHPVAAMREGVQKILRRSPHHLKTLRAMGDLAKEQGQFTEMIHAYSLYLANGGEESEEMDRALASAYMSINDFPSAHRFVKSLLESAEESDGEARERNIAMLQRVIPMAVESGHAADAAEFQKKLELMAPADKMTRVLRQQVDEALGNERFAFLKRELETGKGNENTLEELGDLCLEKEEYNQAITYYQRAARQSGSSRTPRAKLAYSFARKRMFDLCGETLAELKLSLNDDPEELDNLMTWLYRTAEVLEEAHMFERAAKLFKQLMKIDAGYRDVLQRVERLAKK